MKWFVLVTILGVASAQSLFFKPYHQREKVKVENSFGLKKTGYFYTSRKTAVELASKVENEVVICPDKKSACHTGNTCCPLTSGAYACCPLPTAVCCPDKKHCCPFRTHCDVTRGQCIQGRIAISWLEKTSAIPLGNDVVTARGDDLDTKGQNSVEVDTLGAVICPDGLHECENGYTCCKSESGFACCPYSNAVCCSDEIHCCPANSKCDLSGSRCVSGENTIREMAVKKEALIRQKTVDMGMIRQKSVDLGEELESVVCPDGKSECADGQTCCLLNSGEYGCCPLPQAVCCDDHIHCCPQDTTCLTSKGQCQGGEFYLDWFEKTPAKQLKSVVCPGGEVQCPDGNTCCLLASGQYGCCPIPNAVCCNDHVHCCPHDTTCDVSHGTCNRGDIQMTWFRKTPAKQVEMVKCPDGHSECPDGNTCCKLSSGQYGCCPLPQAVCCNDHVHCCPHDTTCDVSHGTCNRGDIQMTWFMKTPAKQVEMVKCPDGHSECPDGNTCCKLSSGQYGCCPLPQAVCCSDGVHCCPHDYTCDVAHGKCDKGDAHVDWFEKTPAKQLENVICPDGTSECPDGNTCCKLSSGQYGCCPLPKAVCCSDGVHCCPHDYTCDVAHGKCDKGDAHVDWFEKTPAKQLENVICPDGTSECPDGNTCCKLSSGQYGCCPLPKAVCCSDGVHCCPHDYTCDVAHGKCDKGDAHIDWFEKTPAKQLENVICPDGTSECPDGNTCCKLSSGQYGCCPLPKAVCCSDGVHCCPHDYTCDVAQGSCKKGDVQVDWFEKTPAKQLENVICPDGSSQCPDGNTCCKLSSGQYGCCPLPKAVCCSDGVHCCPHGYTCDVAQGSCKKGDVQVDWFEKTPAKQLENVICPDGSSQCPDGNTCCKLSSGQYGCCPLPKAVCCSDGVHCCPHDYTCDVAQGSCKKGDVQVDWFEKTPAKQLKNVICPDGSSECPDGNTCCKLSSGQYGCCPLPKAVCCSDGVHCCPNGYTCDVAQGSCKKGDAQVDWFEKTPAKQLENVICPDGTSECPDGNTCCKLSSGQYGCCPLPKAVCCSDGVHCCPNGYTCDVAQGSCKKGDAQVDWFEKTPAKQLENVICPDGSSQCPDGNTCCKLSSGQYGCCPLPKAVCCSDGVHCCPNGYTCDVAQGSCKKGDAQVDWFEKTAAKQLENVICPDGSSQCPDGNTCCKLSSGQYGCCPLPKAVCCSDGVHCCPNGYTCDVAQGSCKKGDAQVDWFEKTPAKQLENVICPDGTSECPDGNTCCKLSSGQYGCCPLPKAVCCSDGVHCCPHGYTCDVAQGSCKKGDVQVDWFEKTPAKQLENVICPDGSSQCPDGNTCCKLSSGQYGCCPLPKAVCCSDGVHCCPHGYTCDVAQGSCKKGDMQVDWFEKTPARMPNPVPCDNTHECPTGNTCCRLASGEWGCCPKPNAVCCSDHVHCCPHATVCNVSAGKCVGDEIVEDWFVKTPAKQLDSVICDDEFECPDGHTCCKTSGGHWACCPIPSAVCCSDHLHCCPKGTKCSGSGHCTSSGLEIDGFLKTLAKPRTDKLKLVGDVVCPDGSECHDGCTCCPMSSGDYGCCPLPNAVCCSDGQHCCPNGFKCNMAKSDCERKGWGEAVPWILMSKKNKKEAKIVPIRQSGVVVCPGGKMSCPELNTCCDDGKGGFSCCPENDAVCCKDHEYCCPHGYICDVSVGICRIPDSTGTQSVFIQKISAKGSHP